MVRSNPCRNIKGAIEYKVWMVKKEIKNLVFEIRNKKRHRKLTEAKCEEICERTGFGEGAILDYQAFEYIM